MLPRFHVKHFVVKLFNSFSGLLDETIVTVPAGDQYITLDDINRNIETDWFLTPGDTITIQEI